MEMISTHVLDTSRGRPAKGVPVRLCIRSSRDQWKLLAKGTTNKDGRIPDLLSKGTKLKKGVYLIIFETAKYFHSTGTKCFYPVVAITFSIQKPRDHYHIPLLLSPYGYSTYRGS
ncbi:MAG: hydroxyisourate hydrolase [Elusimicrobia bacterium]|nr:hydroxyisourate hydrolase [Elusimicrobiota bacterium]